MPDELLAIFKLCFLVLLYLFFFRVLRAVWTEVNTTVSVVGAPQPTKREARRQSKIEARERKAATKGAAAAAASSPLVVPGSAVGRGSDVVASLLVVSEPPNLDGTEYQLVDGLVFGRSSAALITVDDTFMSQKHAGIDLIGGRWTLSDLGSTNGTFLNGVRIQAAVPIGVGDRIQLGSLVMEVR